MTHFEKVPQFPYVRTQKFEAACFFLNLIFRLKGMNLHYSPWGQPQECADQGQTDSPTQAPTPQSENTTPHLPVSIAYSFLQALVTFQPSRVSRGNSKAPWRNLLNLTSCDLLTPW